MLIANNPSQNLSGQTAAISVADLTLRYGSVSVIENLSYDFPKGAFTALIGPNGCGKSTLLKSLTRILTPTAGTIAIDAKPMGDYSAKALAQKIAFLPQVLPVPDGITVRQLVAYGRSPHNNIWGRLGGGDKSAIEAALAQLAVTELADQYVADLSGGQRQRAWIAMIVAQQAPIVLLDEPTTFLDINHQVEVLRFARSLTARGKTVIAVLHDLNQAFRYADNIAVMKAGDLVASGTPDAVAQPDLLRDVFSIDCTIIRDPESNTPMLVVKD
ncbi:ATP-binding cassette domain-containing protein [Rhizobium metallidurans]|uniref:Iron complex transport system ATP-binding protein n=1 Tax=Rhizobium metallidurans TaxID=1265931 RepID=A0A7W6GDB3_9HYPH|nr:ATP-binding cassette domain-containing protein [Rhizobium metallidurans]MBB3967017.1 iron complex transport system ATP-binding protein [Rhizobium metallidurans]